MKSFIIAALLFSLLLASIIANSIYINKNCEHLAEMSASLGEIRDAEFESRLYDLESSWHKFRKIARISCSDSELDKIDLTIVEMRAHYDTESPEGLSVAQARLSLLLRELSRLERISFD